MKILAVESSGTPASVAFLEDGKIKAEFTVTDKLTHSVTLMPLIESMTKIPGIDPSGLDAVAVSAGPGSFTGLRIGIATVKGLTLALNKPVVKVSSLEGLSRNICAPGCFVCPLMDARRGQVYAALFRNGKQLLSDSALSVDEYLDIVEEKAGKTGRCIFLGDGAPVHREVILGRLGKRAVFAAPGSSLQKASSIAVLAEEKLAEGNTVSSDDLVPDYLRVPLAEKLEKSGELGDAGEKSLKKIAKGAVKHGGNH